jgi:hypothetical protein
MVMPMVSMELDDEDKEDALQPYAMPDKPDYPYGLRICLTHTELDKLDLDPSDAFVGGILHGHFMGRITSVSANDGEMGSTCRIEITICALSIESEDAENEEN